MDTGYFELTACIVMCERDRIEHQHAVLSFERIQFELQPERLSY